MSGLYSNIPGMEVKPPTNRMQGTRSDASNVRFDISAVEEESKKPFETIGDGLAVFHGTRLDVDISIRISDLLNDIAALAERITVLEASVGVGDADPAPVNEIRLGIWRLYAFGNSLLTQVDLNAGTTITPNWETRGKDAL